MRKRLILIVLLSSIAGCALLQKTTKSSVENRDKMEAETALTLQSKTDLSRTGSRSTLRKDAVDADYKIHLYPNGALEVNSDGSLTGAFDSILLAGKHQKLSTVQENSEFKEQENQQKASNIEQKFAKNKVHKQLEKEQKPAPNLAIIILITIILIAIVVFARKLYKKNHLFS